MLGTRVGALHLTSGGGRCQIVNRGETGLYPAMQSGDEVKYCFSLAFFSVFLGMWFVVVWRGC